MMTETTRVACLFANMLLYSTFALVVAIGVEGISSGRASEPSCRSCSHVSRLGAHPLSARSVPVQAAAALPAKII